MPHAANFGYKIQNFMEKDKFFLLNKVASCFTGWKLQDYRNRALTYFAKDGFPQVPYNFVIVPTTQYF